MSLHKVKVGTLTIALSGSDSNVLAANELKMARAIIFDNQESAFTGTISVLGGHDEADEFADLNAIELDGTPIVLTADTQEQFSIMGLVSIAIQSSGTEGAERTVDVYAMLDLPSGQ